MVAADNLPLPAMPQTLLRYPHADIKIERKPLFVNTNNAVLYAKTQKKSSEYKIIYPNFTVKENFTRKHIIEGAGCGNCCGG